MLVGVAAEAPETISGASRFVGYFFLTNNAIVDEQIASR